MKYCIIISVDVKCLQFHLELCACCKPYSYGVWWYVVVIVNIMSECKRCMNVSDTNFIVEIYIKCYDLYSATRERGFTRSVCMTNYRLMKYLKHKKSVLSVVGSFIDSCGWYVVCCSALVRPIAIKNYKKIALTSRYIKV